MYLGSHCGTENNGRIVSTFHIYRKKYAEVSNWLVYDQLKPSLTTVSQSMPSPMEKIPNDVFLCVSLVQKILQVLNQFADHHKTGDWSNHPTVVSGDYIEMSRSNCVEPDIRVERSNCGMIDVDAGIEYYFLNHLSLFEIIHYMFIHYHNVGMTPSPTTISLLIQSSLIYLQIYKRETFNQKV